MPIVGRVEKGIPLPERRGGTDHPAINPAASVYPWRQMDVGDSFAVKGISITNMCATARGDALRHGTNYAVRKVDGGGLRVWRIT